ncbi:uncharacterized protein I206_102131 [Kwoniella pini CBS 10737]|uniref:F-box domain-containing protein n=1 Tax=Kwoniella pini CBS 10737 TaxID=1296096 RepID=A0A1B9HUQ3_9TREE|nr:uncharacterized protein I206_06776 [Kwoniella pini CBS 10737]OCF47002.1 hypothetical protein I206_06776 [Kwoniella pini CBS 10737]
MTRSKANRNKNKNKNKSNNKKKNNTSIAYSLDLTTLPSDVLAYLYDHIAQSVDIYTLCKLLLVNSQFNQLFAPALYERIEVNGDNSYQIFYGIDYKVLEEQEWKANKDNKNESYKINLDSHHRKMRSLNLVKSLIISDYDSAMDIAQHLSNEHKAWFKQVEIEFANKSPFAQAMGLISTSLPDNPSVIFNNVENIALGLELLIHPAIYPHCAHHGEFVPDLIASALKKGLDCKNVCYDSRAGDRFHANDEGFGLAIIHIAGEWNHTTSIWHKMNEYPLPCCHARPKYKLYVSDIHETIGPLSHLKDEYPPLAAFIAWYVDMDYWCCAHPRRDERSIIEIAFPDFNGKIPEIQEIIDTGMAIYQDIFWQQTSGEDDMETCMKAAEKRWTERKMSGWFEKYLKVVNLDEAEPCVCCGTK